MIVGRSVVLFVLAALLEIGGAWLVWQGVGEQRGGVWVGAGGGAGGGGGRRAGFVRVRGDVAAGRGVRADSGGVRRGVRGRVDRVGDGRGRVSADAVGCRGGVDLSRRDGGDHVRAAGGLRQ